MLLTRIQPTGSGEIVMLTPSLVSVSCERIKHGVLRLLALPDGYRGRVAVYISPVIPVDQQIRIQSMPFSDGWQYSVAVPERIAWIRFVRAIVEVVLIEAGNRQETERLSLPPLWLSEGITTLLLGEAGRELVPELNREYKDPFRAINPLAAALQRLSGTPPLSFERLGFPSDSDISDAGRFATFQGSAALFLHELLALPGGDAALKRFVLGLSGNLNWQTVFIDSLRPGFQSLLEVEKWWAVQSTSRLLRDPAKLWSKEAARAQLAAILVETSAASGTNSFAGRRNERLSEIVTGWPYESQTEVLDRKITQIRNLFVFTPSEFIDSVREAHEVLQEYRRARSSAASLVRRGELDPRGALLAKAAARRLAAIEIGVIGRP